MLFSENIKWLRRQKGLTQDDVAKSLEVGRTTVTNYEKGNSKPSFDDLVKLSELFNVNLNDLVKSDLERLSTDPIEKDIVPLPIQVDANGDERIVFVDIKASAGYPNFMFDTKYIGKLPSFQLPSLEFQTGTFRCFEIDGDSMDPTISDGDWVIAQFHTNENNAFKQGYIYVVVTNSGVWVKRLVRSKNNQHAELHSDNEIYPTFDVPFNNIKELWLVKKRLTNNLAKPYLSNRINLESLNDRINQLESRTSKLEKRK